MVYCSTTASYVQICDLKKNEITDHCLYLCYTLTIDIPMVNNYDIIIK